MKLKDTPHYVYHSIENIDLGTIPTSLMDIKNLKDFYLSIVGYIYPQSFNKNGTVNINRIAFLCDDMWIDNNHLFVNISIVKTKYGRKLYNLYLKDSNKLNYKLLNEDKNYLKLVCIIR